MKKYLLIALATAMAAAAHANSLSLDLRTDYNSTTYEKSTKLDSTKFYFKTGRLDYQGKASETLSYRARITFNKSAVIASPDGAQPAVEYAYLSHKVTDFFTLTAGKFNTDFGGFEGSTSGADLYLLSEFYSRTGPKGDLTANVLGTKDLLYMTGVKATMTYDAHTFSLLSTNEDTTASKVGPADSQNSTMLGAIWRGAFMDKTLNLNLSYHTLNGAAKDDKHQFTAAGIQWNSNPFLVQADYLMAESKIDATGFKDQINSLVAKFAYTSFEQWTPRVEITSSEEILGGATDTKNKYMGYGAIVEYKPYADTNFRYHVAYNNVKMEPETGDSVTKQEVIVGARLMADFLK